MATDNVAAASGTGLATACSNSIGGEGDFEEGFPKMERSENRSCMLM